MPRNSPSRRVWLSRATLAGIFLLLVIFASASYTLAHRVILFAYVEGDRVFTESCFSDGKKCQNSRIEVFGSLGNKLLEGKTNKDGEFSFTPPKKTDLRIVLTASMGHRDEYVIPEAELPDGTEGKAWKSEPHQAGKKVFQAEKGEEKGAPASQLTRTEMERIRRVVEEVLDEKLKPIMRLLAKRQNERISFIQVMGGIGFIFGIMGIILYFRSRRGR